MSDTKRIIISLNISQDLLDNINSLSQIAKNIQKKNESIMSLAQNNFDSIKPLLDKVNSIKLSKKHLLDSFALYNNALTEFKILDFTTISEQINKLWEMNSTDLTKNFQQIDKKMEAFKTLLEKPLFDFITISN